MEEQKPDLEIVKKEPTYKKFDKAYGDLVAEETKNFQENKGDRHKLNTLHLINTSSPTYNSKPFDLIQKNMLPKSQFKAEDKDDLGRAMTTTNPWRHEDNNFETSEYGIRCSAISDAIKGAKTKLSAPNINHVAAVMYLNGPHPGATIHKNIRACDWNLGCGIGAEPYEDYRSIKSNNPFEDEMTQGKLKDSKYYLDNYGKSPRTNEFDHTLIGLNRTNPSYFHKHVNDDDHWIDLDKPIANLDEEPNKEGNK